LASDPGVGIVTPPGEYPSVKKNRALIIPAVVLGLILIAVAIVYWVEPANSLPSFFPGHDAHSTTHHTKHGIAAFILGLAVLAFAWFQSGTDKRKPEPQ
jgi:hypothetical protein